MAKKKVYDKYVAGDNLTNAEVLEGIASFKAASEALAGLGNTFKLASNEAHRVYWSLRLFGIARGIYEDD
jgi:hypothetical protein